MHRIRELILLLDVLLQGVDPSNVGKVEALVLDKLKEMAETGFTPGAIEAAVNTIEFSLRENNTGSFPRGLSLMLRAVGAWIYNRDPYTPIQVGSDHSIRSSDARNIALASPQHVKRPRLCSHHLTPCMYVFKVCVLYVVQWEEALNNFKAKLAGGGDVFGPLIHKYLLDNKHRVTVTMLPDQQMAAKIEEDERKKLDGIRAQLSEQEVS